MSIFDTIASKIIREQELIIGPIAWSEARKVQGLKVVDATKGEVSFDNGDQKETIDHLVAQYEHIFGRASHEVCREAVASILAELAPGDVPASLRA